MNQLENFATLEQLTNYWKPISADETARAEALLAAASDYLRLVARNAGQDIDKRLAEAEDDLLKRNLQYAVLAAVKRAMLTPADLPPVDQWSQSANPYSETMRFTNPTSDLFFKKSELQLLGLSGGSKFGLLRGIR